jgi:sugar lactone lactonase YvrE
MRDVLYVTNFDALGKSNGEQRQFVSKLAMDGTVLERQWITGLARPTGMVVSGDALYVVERGAVARVDLAAGEIAERIPVAGAVFPNDVALDEAGRLYVSDSAGGTIFRRAGGEFEAWIGPPRILQPNGMFAHGGELFVGDNGDQRLKAINLESGEVRTVAKLGPGVIDGLQADGRGNLVLSHWEGRLLRVSPDGSIEKLLDTTGSGTYLADFEYVPDRDMVFIPTFYGDRVAAYRLTP